MDVQKQIDHWRKGAEEDFEVAGEILEKGRTRHALFFAELAIEKMLKAHVVKVTVAPPPKIHDLLRLAEMARLDPSEKTRLFLARFQEYSLAGRYPERLPPAPTRAEAEVAFKECREVMAWLTNQLS